MFHVQDSLEGAEAAVYVEFELSDLVFRELVAKFLLIENGDPVGNLGKAVVVRGKVGIAIKCLLDVLDCRQNLVYLVNIDLQQILRPNHLLGDVHHSNSQALVRLFSLITRLPNLNSLLGRLTVVQLVAGDELLDSFEVNEGALTQLVLVEQSPELCVVLRALYLAGHVGPL